MTDEPLLTEGESSEQQVGARPQASPAQRLRRAAREARAAKPAPPSREPSTIAGVQPLAVLALVLSIVAAGLLVGGLVFAFATAERSGVDAAGRFRLLGQAANPLIAALALAAALVVVVERGPGWRAGPLQRGSSAALSVATAVSLAVVLLAASGVISDLTGRGGVLFVLSATVTRLAAAALGALTLWLSFTAGPPPD